MLFRLILFALIAAAVVACSPKLATSTSTEDYDEDLSAYRPVVDFEEATVETTTQEVDTKGSYVPPTNDINDELSAVLDSVVYYNKMRPYLTFTIQVYIGRSREEANHVRERVYRFLPNEKPMLAYKQPSWKVTVGTYRDRVEAYKNLTTLKSVFPGATLVPERKYVE
jgi:hypothetical protein